jgi:hypothetical protein
MLCRDVIGILFLSWKKNSALFCRYRAYSAAIAARKTGRDDIAHFCAIATIAAIARYSAAKPK